MNESNEVPDGACEDVALDAEAIAACLDLDAQDQAVMKAAPVVLATCQDVLKQEECDRVCHAARMTMVAIFERLGRAMRRDVVVG